MKTTCSAARIGARAGARPEQARGKGARPETDGGRGQRCFGAAAEAGGGGSGGGERYFSTRRGGAGRTEAALELSLRDELPQAGDDLPQLPAANLHLRDGRWERENGGGCRGESARQGFGGCGKAAGSAQERRGLTDGE